jgi:hypothetical protein
MIEEVTRFSGCIICACEGSMNPICHEEAFCDRCKHKCHFACHCRACWKPTGRKVSAQQACYGNFSNANGASSSKVPQNSHLIDSEDILPNAHLSTELTLLFNYQNAPCSLNTALESSTHSTLLNHPSAPEESLSMAYQRADPRPFTPRGFHALEIQHREFMARAVVNQAHAAHEDFAIVNFSPLPDFAMHFGPVQEILHEFLEDHRRIAVREIQPSRLG